MDKKKWIAMGILALIIAAASFGVYQNNATYITLDGVRYRRDAAELDLSGTAVSEPEKLTGMTQLKTLNLEHTGLSTEDYDLLRSALPDCEILWTPVFQGTPYDADTKILNITTLRADDVGTLDYFPQLQTVNAMDCEDYDNLLALAQRRPEVEVRYSVAIGGREYLHDTTFARIPDADLAQVEASLKYLPNLRSILLTGTLPGLDAIAALASAYPEIAIDWQAEIYGMTLSSDSTQLDLTDIPLKSAEDVEAVLPYLPDVQTVVLIGTGLPEEDIKDLVAAYPEIEFVWHITIGNTTVRSDDVEIDISWNQLTPEDIESLLPYFPRLEKVVMCGCGIDNETMDALNRRHEDIKFVWSVDLGPIVTVRTDITSFIPFKYCVDFYQEDLYNLRYCTDIIALDLGHQQIYSCEFVAFMPNLKYLVLADTKVQDLTPLTGLTNLVYLEIFVTYLQDYEPLLTLTGLRDLNLSWTYGDYEIIAQMPWLERCWWGGHWHNWQVRQYLQEKCPNTQFEFDDGESTGSGWRTGKYYYEMRDALGMFYME